MPESTTKLREEQILRLRRFWMASTLYLMCAVLTIGAWHTHTLTVSGNLLVWLGVGVIATQAMIYGLIRSGLNLIFEDPAMTFGQCVLGFAWLITFMHFIPQWRDLMLGVFPVGIMFGLFHLQTRQFSALALLGFVGLVVLTSYELTIGHPILTRGELLLRLVIGAGVLAWCSYFGSHVSRLRERLGQHNRSLENAISDITRLAERDHLTQAYNRRMIIERLDQLRARALRSNTTFSVIIIDVDFFKTINDRFGHLEGDHVLAAISKRIRSELRLLDEVAPLGNGKRDLGRFGGEEFIVSLPDSDAEGAMQCADRLWRSVRDYEFKHALRVTVSAGVAEYRSQESIDALLARADRALYAAKNAGRDQVQLALSSKPASSESSIIQMVDFQQDR